MNKFIYILKAEDYKSYLEKGLFRILPQMMKLKLNVKIKPRIICEYTLNDNVVGYGVGIVFSEYNITNEIYIDKIINSIENLNLNDVNTISINNLDLLTDYDIANIKRLGKINILSGKNIMKKATLIILKEILEIVKINLSEQEILIVSDDTNSTSNLIFELAKEAKYLTIFSEDRSFTKKIKNDILLKTGLAIHNTNDLRKTNKKYNIIINFKDNIHISNSSINRRTIIYDSSKTKKISKHLWKHRRDLFIISDILFKRPKYLKAEPKEYQLNSYITSGLYEFIVGDEKFDSDLLKVNINNNLFTLNQACEIYIKRGNVRSNFIIKAE